MSFLLSDSHNPIPSLPVELLFISSTTLSMMISSSALVKRLKKGRLIKEKDKIIIESVIEDIKSSSTGKRGIGIWESIRKKIPNRSPDSIKQRWHNALWEDDRVKRVILLLNDITRKRMSSLSCRITHHFIYITITIIMILCTR